jgi:hypothetical protein
MSFSSWHICSRFSSGIDFTSILSTSTKGILFSVIGTAPSNTIKLTSVAQSTQSIGTLPNLQVQQETTVLHPNEQCRNDTELDANPMTPMTEKSI